jgi:hypothetical protein
LILERDPRESESRAVFLAYESRNVGVIDRMYNPQRISAILVLRAGHVAAAYNSCCRAGERLIGFSTLLPIFNASCACFL